MMKGNKKVKSKKTKKTYLKRVPRSLHIRDALPDRVEVQLGAYIKNILNNSGAITYTRGYINCTNPQLSNGGSATNVPYFSEWATLYRKYQVNSVKLQLEFINSEVYGIFPFACPVNYLPPFASNSELASYISNEYSKFTKCGGIAGNSIGGLRMNVPVAVMSGFATDEADTGLVGDSVPGTPPSNNVYLAYGSDNGAASVGGALVGIKVKFKLDFMERQTPQT